MAQFQGYSLKEWGKLQEDTAAIKVRELYIAHMS
jgi:hypothetical protein